MVSRFKIPMILAALILCAFAESRAITFGIRYSDLAQNPLPGIDNIGSKGRFGAFLGFKQNNSILLIGADYDRYKLERGDSLLYARRLVVNIGYRYQLLPIDKAEAMDIYPFAAVHLFKGFSKVAADSTVLSPADVKYFKDLSNDVGAWISLGAEYHFAPAFGMGGEFGLRYSRAKSKAYGHEIKFSQYSSFVAILMTFFW
jgi:hypothetical protein